MKYILILTVCTSVNLIGMLESYESCHNTLAHSPNKEYHIMSSNLGTYYSDDTTKIKIFPHTQMIGKVTISDNSEHFLIELKNNLIHSCSRYKLFKINHKKLPEGVYLKNDLENTTTAIFHHDNKHIIYNKVNGINDVLHLYNMSTSEDTEIASVCDENSIHITDLTPIHDHRLLATTISKHCDTYSYGHILFNIKNLNNVTSVILPKQSYHRKALLPVLCIPYPKMLTHITDNGQTLQLLDETAHTVASHHAPENSYISAIDLDSDGKNLAVGHSDGTINLYEIAFFKLDAKESIQKDGIIKSITFQTYKRNKWLSVESKLSDKSYTTYIVDIQ